MPISNWLEIIMAFWNDQDGENSMEILLKTGTV